MQKSFIKDELFNELFNTNISNNLYLSKNEIS